MTVYRLTLKTLSPIHIGDGNELRQDFDFAVHAKRTYRLNEDAILLARGDRLRPDSRGHYPSPAALLSEDDFKNCPELFRYEVRGFPRSTITDARLRSFIKDVYDRPYIPGSTLKGAFRTALAWAGWPEIKPSLDRSAIGRSRSWAGQPLERQIFGRDPNHDLLRALHVSDLAGPDTAGGGMVIVNAQVLTRRAAQSPIELEAIPGDVTFTGSLTIDEQLFAPVAQRELKFGERCRWISDELLVRARKHSYARLEELAAWFETAQDAHRIAAFYRQLLGSRLAENQAILQIGWGAGWDGKTFGSHLKQNPQLFRQLVSEFRMQRIDRGSSPRDPNTGFPSSRRVAMAVKGGRPLAAAPFGWVLVELEKE